MASNKFVRASLYRHVHGVASKPENEFTHIKAQATGDGTFIAANEKLFAYAGALPGRVHIWPLDKPGRIGADAPYIHVHKAGVLDYEFNGLFHDELTGGGTASLLATASDDCAVAVTAIPNTGLKSNITDATLSLQGHERRVNVVHWHPTASNLLATGSADQTIKVWDIGAQKEALSFDGFGDGVSAFDWHCHGAHLIATCKDTKVRVYDPRSTDSVQTFQGFNGAGISRMVWKGDSTQVIGVGNIKGGSRQMGIWDTKNPSKPIMVQDLDNAGGSLFPYYDPDNTILYISGKGDGQIRYWEVTEDEPYVHFISAFTDTKSHAGVAFLPKKACDYAECEIAIALRMMGDKVTKVSFRVPRKQTGPTVFHKDLYPETSSGLKPAALSADEWLGGENRPIVKMPMNIASGAREMSSALATPTSRAPSASVSGTISPRGVSASASLSAPTSTSGRSIPELERMLAQAKLKIMDLQAELFELEQKAAKKTLDKDSAATVKAAASTTTSSASGSTATSTSAAATSTSQTASNTTSPISSPRDSSASVTTRDAAASVSTSTEALPGESEAQTAARIKKAKAKAAADAAREKEAAKAAEKNTSAELDKAKKEAEDKIRREQQAVQAERDAETKAAKEAAEKADKKLKEEQQAAEKKVKEEAEKAEKKAKEEKEKAEKKAKEEREAADKKTKEEKEAAEKKLKVEKEKGEKEAATLKAEREAVLRKASAASAASADSDASHHMRFHGDDDNDDDDDAEAERLRAETVAKAEAIERAEALAKKQKEIEAKAKATMEDKKQKKAKDDTSDMKTSASAAVSAATSAATSPTNSAPSSEPSSPTGSKKGKKGKKDKKDKKKGDCIIC